MVNVVLQGSVNAWPFELSVGEGLAAQYNFDEPMEDGQQDVVLARANELLASYDALNVTTYATTHHYVKSSPAEGTYVIEPMEIPG